MNNGKVIVIHGAPGSGKTTVGGLLHEKLKCPWFEFGWIPEFRNLNPHTEIPYAQEEQLSFSSLALVANNYLAHGFEHVILTDLPDRLVKTLPEVYGKDGYALFMLYSEDDEIIKNRILTRTNGNLYKDWEAALELNRVIKERLPLAHEMRIRSDQMSAEAIAEMIYEVTMQKRTAFAAFEACIMSTGERSGTMSVSPLREIKLTKAVKQIMNQSQWKTELETRIQKLIGALAEANPDFETALVAGRINQYYLTGTMQDAVLILKRDGNAYLFVRKSVERAKDECPLDIIYPMGSYRDILQVLSPEFGATYLETEIIPIAMMERFRKYFKMDRILPFEPVISAQRAVKSPYELDLIIRSGKQHKILLEEVVPTLLKEGISEAEFHGELFAAMMKLGHHGVSRFAMFQFEAVAGQLGFGDNSVYPTNFDGPGGMRGMNAASPGLGSRERKLRKGDLVFVDVGFGIDGYNSDKTQVYSFGKAPDPEVLKIHRACLELEKRCAEMLVAGAIPSEIYAELTDNLPPELSTGFMGYGQSVKFLGHGIGLHVNELPVIAKGFDEPIKENMVFAVEPKCGLPGIGTVGVEDTYIVKADHSECVTGGGTDIITV